MRGRVVGCAQAASKMKALSTPAGIRKGLFTLLNGHTVQEEIQNTLPGIYYNFSPPN